MLNKNLLNKFKKATLDKSKAFKSPVEFFLKLRDKDFSRLELMILDSAIKNMPLERLYNTLLLSEESYYKIIEELTKKLTIT